MGPRLPQRREKQSAFGPRTRSRSTSSTAKSLRAGRRRRALELQGCEPESLAAQRAFPSHSGSKVKPEICGTLPPYPFFVSVHSARVEYWPHGALEEAFRGARYGRVGSSGVQIARFGLAWGRVEVEPCNATPPVFFRKCSF